MNIVFQPYTPKWRQKVLQLHTEAMAGFDAAMQPTGESADLENINLHYSGNAGRFFVGREEDELVAMGGFRFVSEGVAELKRMRIKSDHQGRGLGAALLLRLEEEATALGLKKLVLETASARPLTLRFYEKHGYSRYDEGLYGTIPVIRFQKELKDRPIQRQH